MSIELVKGKQHLVIKRDGRVEPYNEEKLKKVLMWATDNDEIMVEEVLKDIDLKIYNKIHIATLFDEVIETVANKISELYPQWDEVAKRLYLQKIYKETWGMKRNEYPDYMNVIQRGIETGLYDKSVIDYFTEEELKELGRYIKPERDFNFDYLGLRVIMDKYSLKINEYTNLELPQHIFMRLAIFGFYKEPKEERLSLIKKRYDDLSNFIYTEATPKYFNSLTPSPQMASCVLTIMGDDSYSINHTLTNLGIYSKYGGGTACDVSHIRAKGSKIRKSGKSSGIIPYIKLIEGMMTAYDQLGKRMGACCVYCNWWHLEIEDFIMLKDEGGTEDNRARKLKYSIKLNRLFIDRLLKNENITLFDPKDVPELLTTYGEEFNKWYEYYENKDNIRKKVIKAIDLAYLIAKVRMETGNLYIFFVENTNEHTPFKEYINSSNLCVAPETRILTKEYGYSKTIEELENQKVSVWNGEEWSEVIIKKTGENQKLIKIETTCGVIECTPYHKFYVQEGYSGKGKVIEKRAEELKVGDRLIKFDLPLIEGNQELSFAYENGLYSAEGCKISKNRGVIYLYDQKKKLLSYLRGYLGIREEIYNNRIVVIYDFNTLKEKFFVPIGKYTVKSKVEWLAGVLDGDGVVCKNEDTQSIQLGSVNYTFLHNILLMLQELGVTAKITKSRSAGYCKLPKNDGTGEYKDYYCQTVYRLLISESGVQKLLNLGLSCKRLKLVKRNPNRNAEQFIKVISISDENRYDNTYCFTEPKKHLGMFNGLLTGQCSEVILPTKPSYLKEDKLIKDYSTDKVEIQRIIDSGIIALCNLSSINVVKWMELTEKEKEEVAYNLLRASDNLIDYAYYPSKEGEYSNKYYRPIGIGISNLAQYFASKGIKFTDDKAFEEMDKIMYNIYYHIIKASTKLAKERGVFEGYYNTKWSEGWMPYEVSELKELIQKYGVRFATHFALPPTATSSLIAGATESFEPIKEYVALKTGTYNCLQLAPNLKKYRGYYQLAWEIPNEVLFKLASIRQKYIEQGQSLNQYDDGSYSAYKMWQEIILAEKLGLKSLYYFVPRKAELDQCESCSS